MVKAAADITRVLEHISLIPKACAFIVGGSDEMALPLVINSKIGALIVDASLDV